MELVNWELVELDAQLCTCYIHSRDLLDPTMGRNIAIMAYTDKIMHRM